MTLTPEVPSARSASLTSAQLATLQRLWHIAGLPPVSGYGIALLAMAVAADPTGEGVSAATAAAGLDPSRLAVLVADDGERVTVTVRYAVPTDVPLVGALVGDVTVTGTATMRTEP